MKFYSEDHGVATQFLLDGDQYKDYAGRSIWTLHQIKYLMEGYNPFVYYNPISEEAEQVPLSETSEYLELIIREAVLAEDLTPLEGDFKDNVEEITFRPAEIINWLDKPARRHLYELEEWVRLILPDKRYAKRKTRPPKHKPSDLYLLYLLRVELLKLEGKDQKEYKRNPYVNKEKFIELFLDKLPTKYMNSRGLKKGFDALRKAIDYHQSEEAFVKYYKRFHGFGEE